MKGSVSLIISLKSFEVSLFTIRSFRTEFCSLKWLGGSFNYFFFAQLEKSKDESLAAVAEKSLKEVTYHLRWSSEWVVRLGDGTDESHARMQQAVNELWMYTGELFIANETDEAMGQAFGVDLETIKPLWMERVREVLNEATIDIPQDAWMQQGGREGRHSEHLGYVLAELQFMQRAYPGMEW